MVLPYRLNKLGRGVVCAGYARPQYPASSLLREDAFCLITLTPGAWESCKSKKACAVAQALSTNKVITPNLVF